VKVAEDPERPSSQKGKDYDELVRQYEAARAAWDRNWDEPRSTPTYAEAWEAALARKREKAVKECVIRRAAKEGAVAR
jgi:hypothetical protein